ncbi:uncharacterized protein TNCV_188231 [Trichonephila clavipes]|nr:uncharacterized protein TNCV_188231 [Trichonephila clavipes]
MKSLIGVNAASLTPVTEHRTVLHVTEHRHVERLTCRGSKFPRWRGVEAAILDSIPATSAALRYAPGYQISSINFSSVKEMSSIASNTAVCICVLGCIDILLPKNLKTYQCGERAGTTATVAEWYRYRIVACLVTSSSPVPLKTRRVGQRCTLNLSRAETSSLWCGVVVRRGDASSGVVHVT